MAKGFKKRYFSLAAITATVSLVALNAQAASVESIEKVVVSADKSEKPIEDVTDDVTVITAEEIEEKGLRSLKEVLEYVSGVNVVSNGGYGKATSVFLRGLSNDKVLILIDGVRYNDPSNFNGPAIEHLLLTNVERIEIVRGAQSGVWGSDAAAGVINIVTSSKDERRFYLGVGSFATKEAKGHIAKHGKSGGFSLGFRFFDTRGYSAYVPKGASPTDYESDGYTNKQLNLKLSYMPLESVGIEIGTTQIVANNEADSAPLPDSINDDTFDYQNYFFNLTSAFGAHQLQIHADSSNTKRKFLQALFSWQVRDYQGKTTRIEVKDRIDYTYGSFQLGVGQETFKTKVIKPDSTRYNLSNTDKYLFATNTIRFDQLLLSQAIRYDAYSKFDNQVTGKIGLKYRLAQKVELFANWGKAYNIPNQLKVVNPWANPNYDLQPEKTYSYDIGVAYKDFKVVYFKERVKDLINWYDPDPNVWGDEYYKNFDGTSTFKGVELTYAAALTDTLFMQLGFTYLDPKDAQGNYIPRRAKRKYSYALTWYPTHEHTINVSGYYIGKRWDDAQKRIETGSYNVTNITASHQFARNFKGFVQIKNLFDRRYTEAADTYYTQYSYAGEPRGIYVGIEATF